MTQTRASRKRNHQELEEDAGMFLPLSKRRDFNFNGPSPFRSGHGSPGNDEVDGMERLQIGALCTEASSSHVHTTSPKMSGAMISPSMQGDIANQQFLPSHHQQQQHLHPCSPTAPHPHMLATNLVSNHDGNGVLGGSEGLGLPNVPVSPAHSPPQGLSNSLSNSPYDEINRTLREAHFSRISRINGVELRPDELHL
ncbi:uncharacterized protein [Amphiura filiformis]|uniref:uncharacterized protein n=1 Tax=Amphiura filiformis TaxID=82378 RepID=UPI003B2285A0